ncbi:hypothetical protein FKW77_004910 [Venturia effusa]|uniref:RRM domain-containing protein n=1 Tax=Venturia effusa TaxID=50376 RepID=A0A517LLG1_9PEZI|nr:hypothetical protein FKW77_004910 [Venturia effusa]
MSLETTKTKRKSSDRRAKTSDDAPPAKKAKTTTTEAPPPKPEKVKAAADAKKNRKRAADFIDTAEVEDEKIEPVPKKSKKSKVDRKDKKAAKPVEGAEVTEAVEATEQTTPVASKLKKSKVDKKDKKAANPVEVAEVTEAAEVTEQTTPVASKLKKSKVDRKDKKAAKPVEGAEVIEAAEVTEQTTPVASKPKKSKVDKGDKKADKTVEIAEVAEVTEKTTPAASKSKKNKVDRRGKKAAAEPVTSILKTKEGKTDKTNGESKELISADSLADAFNGFSSGEEDDVADQTAKLLAGFESTDESEAGDDEGIPLDMVPKAKLDKAAKKALAAATQDADDVPGTIYVGRVPHGFYEHQMKAYFSQFGDVTRLRLARNKKTGASKHYAFVEFASKEVAEIVARTMDKYLMFGHIMQLRLMSQEQVHKDLWKGAGKRFKVIPRAKLAARDLELPKGRAYWKKRIASEAKARAEKAKELRELGYEIDMPPVREVEDVAMKGTGETVAVTEEAQADAGADEVEETAVDEPIKAIEPASSVVVDPVEREVMSVIKKKKTKGKGSEIVGDAVRVTKKPKKEKKNVKA